MLGVKTGGILFTQPSIPGSPSISAVTILSGGTVFEKKTKKVNCNLSVGTDDGTKYVDVNPWEPTCKMFRDVI